MLFKPETHALVADREAGDVDSNAHGLWSTLAWFAGLLVLTSLLGFILALAIFLFAFMPFPLRQGTGLRRSLYRGRDRVHVFHGRASSTGIFRRAFCSPSWTCHGR